MAFITSSSVTGAMTIPESQAIFTPVANELGTVLTTISVTFVCNFNAGDVFEIQWISNKDKMILSKITQHFF